MNSTTESVTDTAQYRLATESDDQEDMPQEGDPIELFHPSVSTFLELMKYTSFLLSMAVIVVAIAVLVAARRLSHSEDEDIESSAPVGSERGSDGGEKGPHHERQVSNSSTRSTSSPEDMFSVKSGESVSGLGRLLSLKSVY